MTEPENTAEQTTAGAAPAVRGGGLLLLALIIGSLCWYLMADRFTPFTDQARVQGYVVGVAPKVGGVVTEVFVRENQRVLEGEPLFQIDTANYEIALEKARSDLQSAQRQVEAGDAGVESARANLLAAQANAVKAQKDTQRLERLRKEDPGTISMRRLEISRASLDQAEARVTAAEADIRRAIEQKGGDDDTDNAILKAAASAVEKAQLDLDNSRVTASSAGVVSDLRADVGQFAGTGSPVVTLISVQDVWINAEFTENNLGNMREGDAAEILFDALPGRVFAGRVRSIGVGVSAGQEPPPGTLPTISNNRDWLRQSQRFPVLVSFDVQQGDELYQQLRLGGQASVMTYVEGHGVLALLGKLYIRVMSVFAYAY